MLGIFLDTETNGLNPKRHKPIELAFKIIDLLTGEEKDSFNSLITISNEDWGKSDPISLKVSGLTKEKLSHGIPIEEVSAQVKNLFNKHRLIRGEAVFICQNPSFDRAFFSQIIDIETQEKLNIPYHWLDLASMFWSYTMEKAKMHNSPFPWETGFTKDKIAQHFHLSTEHQPHRAINGVNHLLLCYEAVVGFPKKHELV